MLCYNTMQMPGNKMDSHNLATLFGPNILHKAKGGAFQVESQERAEERVEVIQVVKEMIDHQHDIYGVCTSSECYSWKTQENTYSFHNFLAYHSPCRPIAYNVT